ncbi:MAG: ABC-three component system middle component 2 [Candidatus Limnocylindrales bacterium]
MRELDAPRVAPEALTWFRVGQLLLLLGVASELRATPVDLDRLGYYDFFAANPFLVVEAGSQDDTRLQLAGLTARNLDYQSASQRFANRRARLEHDLALLQAYGHVTTVWARRRLEFDVTEPGQEVAARFASLYASTYRLSARTVIRRLKGVSDRALRDSARTWLKNEALFVDLYD